MDARAISAWAGWLRENFPVRRGNPRGVAGGPGRAAADFCRAKQATFQLERQLLGEPGLAGYTRLRILSFERLAESVLERLREPKPRLLSEEGRAMVLARAAGPSPGRFENLPRQARDGRLCGAIEPRVARIATARDGAGTLAALAAGMELTEPLRRKLADLALLQRDFEEWIVKHNIRDAGCLPIWLRPRWATAGRNRWRRPCGWMVSAN